MGMKMTMDMGTGLSPSAVIADVTSGTFRMITADGDATIYASGLDLSGYTGRKIVVTDSSGNEAVGYGHSADEAESTTELMTNGDNESAMATFDEDSNSNCTVAQSSDQAHGGSNSMKMTTDGSRGYRRLYDTDESVVTDGEIFKISAWVYVPSGLGTDKARFLWNPDIGSSVVADNTPTVDAWEKLELNYYTGETVFKLILDMASADYLNGDAIYWDDISILRVDSLGTTALQLRNARTGSTRNLASKDAGFDPNDIAKIEVFM
jgi:hypothetical protein